MGRELGRQEDSQGRTGHSGDYSDAYNGHGGIWGQIQSAIWTLVLVTCKRRSHLNKQWTSESAYVDFVMESKCLHGHFGKEETEPRWKPWATALPLGPQCPSPGLISVYCSAEQHWQEGTTCQLYKCSGCWQPQPSVPTTSHCQYLRRSAQGGSLGSGRVTTQSSPRPAADESEGTKPAPSAFGKDTPAVAPHHLPGVR